VVPAAAPAATYTANLTVTNSVTGCISSAYAISVTINLTSTITLGANPAVCSGITSANLTYSATTGTPNQYSIVYSAAALGAGFVNVTNAVLPASPINLVVPAAAPAATYTGILTVSNSITGCLSGGYSISVTVVALPTTPAIGGGGKTAMCRGTNGQFYSVPLNAGNTYTWSIAPATPIALGGNATDNFIVLNFPNPGVYTLSVREFTPAPLGCAGPIQTLTIRVYDNPTADAGLPRTICEGVPTTLGGAPTASGGSGTFTYLWTPSFGLDDATLPNPVATTNATRTYTLNVTDVVSGCAPVINSVVVTVNPLPTAYNVTGADYYCFGTPGITLTLSGSQLGVNYQLYKNAVVNGVVIPGTGAGLNWPNLTTGTYTVRATNATTLCANNMNGSVTVAENPVITITSVTAADPGCSTSSDGVIQINASGGTGALSYSINNGLTFQSSSTFTNLPGAIYHIVVKDINGCTATVDRTLTSPPALVGSVSSQTNVSCFGGLNGSVTLLASGGTGPYTYNVDGGAFSGSALFTGLTAGPHTFMVRDNNLCFVFVNTTITQPVVLTVTATHVDVLCFGNATGSATATPAGGTAPYTYSWNTVPVQTAATATGLAAGTYNVTVTDNNGCTANTNVTITQPIILTVTTSQVNVLCNGNATGTATATPSGGSGPYTYSWNTVPVQTTATATGLIAGAYTVTVTDNNGCITPAIVTITQPAALSVTTTQVNVLCFGNSTGSATATPAGGTAPYTYSWNSVPVQTTATASNITAGSYTVTVRDANNCTTTATVNITQPVAALTLTTTKVDVLCNGNTTGSATVTPAGGTAPYTYSWNTIPVQTAATATGLAAGSYSVTVTDNNGCTATTNVSIIQPTALTISISQTNVNCFGNSTATATATPSGGAAPYTYSWNTVPVQTTPTATGLAANSYIVTVTDNNGCISTAGVTITQPAAPLTVTTTQVNERCFGGLTGSATATPAGGTAPYSYSWNTVPVQTTAMAINLSAVSYTVTITDSKGCVSTANVIITQPAAPLTVTTTQVDVLCFGGLTGSATATPAGGTGPYTYAWNTIPVQTTATATTLTAGNHTVTVTDANNCTASAIVTITQPVAPVTITMSQINADCSGNSTGTATATPAGGTGPYTYAWYSDAALTIPIGQTTATATGLAAGTYWVRVTDASLCTSSASVTLTQPAAVAITAAVTSSHNGSQISCPASTDGVITVSGIGGTSPYQYNLNGGAYQAGTTFGGQGAGTYLMGIRDSHGCTSTVNVTITPPLIITASATVTSNYFGSQLSCNTSTDGRINVTATGGTGAYSYTSVQIPGNITGAATGVFTALPAGPAFTFTVTDINGCSVTTLPVSIAAPPALTLAVNILSNFNGRDISCFGASDGRVEAVVTGGTGSYSYNWYSDPAMTISIGQVTAVALNLSAGTYYVRVRDINNCTTSGSITLNQPVALDASITAQTNVVCFGGNTGSVTVVANPATGTAPYDYSINGGGSWFGSGTFSNLNASIYTVIARDANGCLKQVPVTITQLTQLNGIVTKTDVSCKGNNDGMITISSPSGGSGNYQYSVDGGVNYVASGNFVNLGPATYNVYMRDMANPACSVLLSPNLVITEPIQLGLTSTGDILLDCNGDMDGTGAFYASGGTLPYHFIVVSNTGATIPISGFNSQSFFNAGLGTITTTVTDFHGCSAQATINVTQPALLTPGTIGTNQVLCAGDNPAQLTETVPAAGGPGAYIFQWQYGSTATGPFFNIAGANGTLYTPPAGAINTFYYRRMITSGLCIPVYSNVIQVLVNPKPVAILSGGETICPSQSSILKVNMMVGTGPFEIDINNLGTITGYVSGADITVSPLVTTTYTLLRVRDANGCEVLSPSANLLGSAIVTVRAMPAITSSPVSKTICEYGLVAFNVVATGTDLTYQWYVNTGSGFNPVADGGVYFGATNSTLSLFGATRTMNGYVYHVVVTGCSSSVNSADATLTVNTAPEIATQPKDTTACLNAGAAFIVSATGTGINYQWQVNKGSGFINVVDDANFSGSTLNTLTVTNAQAAFNNYIFRVILTGTCGIPTYSNFAVLRVNIPPVITLNPVNKAACDGTGPVIFSGNGSGIIDSLRWQVFSGGIWSDVHDNAIYSGSTSQQLTLITAPLALSGNQYRLALKAKCITINTTGATLTVNANPVVDFSAVDPIHACGNVPLVINGNPSGGSGVWSTHVWTGDVGPLNNYFIQSPTFNSQIAGNYVLNYKVRDNNGCFGNANVTVIVDAPDATFTQDRSNGCTPATVSFTKDMAGIAKFWWDFGDGSPIDSVSANPVHTFTNSVPSSIEYYNVKLTVRSPGGCLDIFTSSVTVYPAIDATFTATPPVVCSGNMIVFTAQPGASKYFWNFGDGVSGYFPNSANHLYTNFTTAAVNDTVTLTTTSFYGCSDVKKLIVKVMPVPLPQFTASPVLQEYDAAGNPVVFTNTTNPGTWTWLWKFGDGSTSTDQNPTHTYTTLGNFDVVLIVGNSNCTDSVKHQVRITPKRPIANFDLIPSGCSPLTVTINNTSLNTETPGTSYLWDFGDGGISTSKNPEYTYFNPGTYKVTLTVTGPGGVSTYSQVQLVNSYPSPLVNFEVSPTVVFVNDEKVRMFNLTQGADSYLWNFGDGDTSKVKEPFHKYMEEGVYDVTLWAYLHNIIGVDTVVCSSKYVLSPAVTVEPAGVIRFSTVFRPNKDAEIEMDHLPIGGPEIDQFFFPPIREKVINYKLQIFNRLGVLIFESHDINKPWNGYYHSKLCQQGVYVWYVEGKYANGMPFKKVGDVTLLH
jgi:PKD repeat protein